MRTSTVCFILDKDKILLAMKKRGFGAGKWNGYGGKVNQGENLTEAAIRETEEEIGVVLEPANLINSGYIDFSYDQNPDWNQRMHIFVSKSWHGEPKESEEMAPKWFNLAKIPYARMWQDDKIWLPEILSGKKIEANFQFNKTGDIEKYNINTISPLVFESYMAAVKNSVGSKQYKNFYALINGKKKDITENGRISCALHVSSILKTFGLIKETHLTVNSTVKDMRENGWVKTKNPSIGSVILWEEQFQNGSANKHLGFYIGNDKVVSNSSSLGEPKIHHYTYGNGKAKRKIEEIYTFDFNNYSFKK